MLLSTQPPQSQHAHLFWRKRVPDDGCTKRSVVNEEYAHVVSDSEPAKYKSCLRGQRVAKPTLKTIRFHASVNIMAYPTQCELDNDAKKYVPLAMPSEWNVASILVRRCDDTDEAIFPVIGKVRDRKRKLAEAAAIYPGIRNGHSRLGYT